MKIIYGVSGEGLGHVFEAIELISHLRREGHAVKVLTYGDRAFNFLRPFDAIRIEGVHLEVTRRGFSPWLTFLKNVRIIGFYLKNWSRLKKAISDFKPDVFITAFEPYTTLISHIFHKPLISVDNQNELLYIRKPKGVSGFDFKLTQWSTRVCTWGAAHYIVKSFGKTISPKSNIHCVFPIIQAETRKLTPAVGDHIFLYLTKPNPALIEILKGRPEKCIVYCNDKVGLDGNITYRASGGTDYLEDLRTCKAIMATTGFSLIADAFFLKKPFFGVPLKNQFEQVFNAHILRQFCIGEFSENVKREEIDLFLKRLPEFRVTLEKHHFDPTEQERTLVNILGKIRQG
jgi:uncharacterized protein (TIGR00661 family)